MKNVMRDPGESDAKELAAKGMQRLPFPKLELLQMRDFLDPDFCAELVTMIDAKRRPSTLADHYGDDTFRTSETCDLPPDDPVAAMSRVRRDVEIARVPFYRRGDTRPARSPRARPTDERPLDFPPHHMRPR